MFFFKKSIYDYKVLDKVKINLEKVRNNANSKLIKKYENNEYEIYNYQEDKYSNLFALVVKKNNLREVLFLGHAYDLYCVFDDFVFMCNERCEIMHDYEKIKSINLNSGEEKYYDLRKDYTEAEIINGYGRIYTADKYTKMNIIDDKLVIIAERKKSDLERLKNDKYNRNMKYKVIFECIDNKFVPHLISDDGQTMYVSNEYWKNIIKNNLMKIKKWKYITDEKIVFYYFLFFMKFVFSILKKINLLVENAIFNHIINTKIKIQ